MELFNPFFCEFYLQEINLTHFIKNFADINVLK